MISEKNTNKIWEGKIWDDMGRFGKTLEDLGRLGMIWDVGKFCEGLGRHGKIWED